MEETLFQEMSISQYTLLYRRWFSSKISVHVLVLSQVTLIGTFRELSSNYVMYIKTHFMMQIL